MKFNFKEKNNGSICYWFGINEKFTPNRPPDFISKSSKKIVSFDPYLDFDAFSEDETIAIDHCDCEWSDEGYDKVWHVIDRFMGKDGDEGFLFELKGSQKVSKYWYTKTGVYRLSDHWGKVAKSQWDIKEGFQLGYANFSDFIPFQVKQIKPEPEYYSDKVAFGYRKHRI